MRIQRSNCCSALAPALILLVILIASPTIQAQSCHPNCVCSETITLVDQCDSCPATSFNRINNVGAKCPCKSQHYPESGSQQCTPCNPTLFCKTCLDGTSCDTCDEDTNNRIKVGVSCECKPQTYSTGGVLCEPCFHISCDECTTGTSCSACSAADKRDTTVNPTSGKCDCLDRFWDAGIKTCQPCHYSCKTCSTGAVCTSCDEENDHRSEINSEQKCICMDGYYQVSGSTDSVCLKCDYTCKTCSGSDLPCTACDETSFRISNYDLTDLRCLCPDLRFYEAVPPNIICQKCHYRCRTCSNYDSCASCDGSLHRENNSPYCKCADKFYDDGSHEECLRCNHTCQTCSAGTSCDNCDGALHRVTKAPLCGCDLRWYDNYVDEACLACTYFCKECTLESHPSCTSCDETKFRVLNPTTKNCDCIEGYRNNGGLEACQKCNHTCSTCNDDREICTSCNTAKHRKATINGDGKCECEDKFYDNYVDQECQPCDNSCHQCMDTANYCTGCSSDRTYDSGVHTCSCQPQLFFDDQVHEACQACHVTCLSCNGPLETNCQTCQGDSTGQREPYLTTQCRCKNRFFNTSGQMLCTPCTSHTCKRCDANQNECSACDTSKKWKTNPTSAKVCECEPKHYDDGIDTCHPCFDASCASCVNGVRCDTCDTNKFRKVPVNSGTGKCDCLDRYYNVADQEQCDRCQYSCAQCLTGSSCTNCDGTKHRIWDDSHVLCKCDEDNFFFDAENSTEECLPCHYSCDTCSGFRNTSCTACDSAMNRQQLGSGPSFECECKFYFYDNGEDEACESCHYSCKRCFGPERNQCLMCNSGAHRIPGPDNQCICDQKFFDDGTIEECQPCHYSCKNCVDGRFRYNCTECSESPDKRQLDTQTDGKYCICSIGWFDDDLNMQCKSCHYSCKTCKYGNTKYSCTSCEPENTHKRKPIATSAGIGECYCTDKFYDVTGNRVCQPCYYACKTCSGGDTYDKCTSCSQDPPYNRSSLTSGECPCVLHYYDIPNDEHCHPCHFSCWVCIGGNGPTNCDSCNEAVTKRSLSGSFECLCITGYFEVPDQPVCAQCNYTCWKCETTAETCTECPDQAIYFRDPLTDSDTCPCKTGYYDNGFSKTCQQCHYTCAACSIGPQSNMCTECPAGKNRIETPLSGTCPCKDKFYDDNTDNQECLPCDPVCQTCRGPGRENCTSCVNDNRVLSQTCNCQAGFFELAYDVTCHSCNATCRTCGENNENNKCKSCYPSDISFRQFVTILDPHGKCQCLEGYYDDFEHYYCFKCHYTCKTCTDGTSCASCDDNANREIDANNQCVCKTDFVEVPGQTNCRGACHFSCLTCTAPTDTSCDSCVDVAISFRIKSGTSCVCKDVNYYNVDGDYKCHKCHYSCKTCNSSPSKFECSSCPDAPAAHRSQVLTSDKQCLCEDNFYDDGTNTNCQKCHHSCETCNTGLSGGCISCPSGSFRDSSKLPQCPCNDRYFDNGAVTCQECHYSCLTCSVDNSQYSCDSCSALRILKNRQCICGVGKFDDGQNETCKTCHISCLTCANSESAFSCTSCPDQATYNRISTSLPECACEYGYYDTGAKKCEKCSSPCKTCAGSPTICTSCYTGEFEFSKLINQQCFCGDGYYHNGTDNTCRKCDYSCGTCVTSPTNCLTCPPSTSFRTTSAVDGYCNCTEGYYDTPGNTVCAKCSYQCLSCVESSDKCTSCLSVDISHRRYNSSQCLCIDLFFNIENLSVCQRCHYTCVRCENFGGDQCSVCSNPDYQTQRVYNSTTGKCICEGKFYDDGFQLQCQPCHFSCKTCSGGLATQCQSCAIDSSTNRTELKSDGTCPCQIGYFDSNKYSACSMCHYSCLTCVVGNGRKQCTSCSSQSTTFRLPLFQDQCLCQSGYFDVEGYQTCQRCNHSCATCLGNKFNCTTCPAASSMRITSPVDGSCPCLSGYYDVADNSQCQKCLPKCLTCSSLTVCITCNSTNNFRVTVPASGECGCLDGYFEVGNNPLCNMCHYSCLTCVGSNSSNTCQSCSTNTTYHRKTATNGYCNCTEGYYDDGYRAICQKCAYQCYTCNTPTVCLSCLQNGVTSRNNTVNPNSGKCDCLNGYYDNGQDMNCLKCHHSCLTCMNSYSCSSCDQDPSLKRRLTPITNGFCSCIDGYSENGTEKACVEKICHFSCLTCTDRNNALACSDCQPHRYKTSSNSCLCSNGFYENITLETCEPCKNSCETCSNSYECVTCPNPTQFHRNQFVDSAKQCRCWPGYYDDGASKACQLCYHSCKTCSGPEKTHCQQCPDSATSFRYKNTTTNECLCETGYYDDGSSQNCKKCHYSCYACTNSTACTHCPTNPEFKRTTLSNYCLCNAGYYDTGASNQQCQTCSNTCETCLNASYCLTCPQMSYRASAPTPQGQCPCIEGYYDKQLQVCSKCSPVCQSCTDQYFCTSCNSNRILHSNSGECKCPSAYFQNSTDQCEKCSQFCKTCSQATYCLSCEANMHRVLNRSSLCQCQAGYTDVGAPECIQCHHSCATCTNPLTCETCHGDSKLNRQPQPDVNNSQCNCISGFIEDLQNRVQCIQVVVQTTQNSTESIFQKKETVIVAGTVAGSTALGVGSTVIVKKLLLNRGMAKIKPSGNVGSLNKGNQLSKTFNQSKKPDFQKLSQKNNKQQLGNQKQPGNQKLKRLKKVKKTDVTLDDSVGVLVE